MKPLVIYHDNCTDGFGSAFAAWKKFGDEAEYLPMNYGQQVEKWFADSFHTDEVVSILDNRDVYVIDFSLPLEQTKYLIENAAKFVWLDHHKSAFEMWCGKYDRGMRWHELQGRNDEAFILLDDNKSGALLAWEYFHPGAGVPTLVRHIDDRDRWQFKMEASKEFHAWLSSIKPWSFEQWDSAGPIYKISVARMEPSVAPDSDYYAALDQGAAILRVQNAHVKSMAKNARKIVISLDERPAPRPVAIGVAVNSCLHQSELGHELANTSGTYGLVYYVGSDNKAKCSLRSNGDYDVSVIAKAFGGGGHKNAAGFETDIQTLTGWLK